MIHISAWFQGGVTYNIFHAICHYRCIIDHRYTGCSVTHNAEVRIIEIVANRFILRHFLFYGAKLHPLYKKACYLV